MANLRSRSGSRCQGGFLPWAHIADISLFTRNVIQGMIEASQLAMLVSSTLCCLLFTILHAPWNNGAVVNKTNHEKRGSPLGRNDYAEHVISCILLMGSLRGIPMESGQ